MISNSKQITDTNNYYSGTSGLVLPVPNKQFVPEEFRDKTRLAYVASLFNSLEVNSSFYKIPMAKTVQKWAAEVPDGFQFTFKLWKGITHIKELNFESIDVRHFMEVIAGAGNKKGCLLLQFPPGLKAGVHDVERLLKVIDDCNEGRAWKVCVEFRNNKWYNPEIYNVLNGYGAGMVEHDMPSCTTPNTNNKTDFTYIRFHGPAGDYRGGYDDDFLQEQATYINERRQEGKTVYVYFNNTIGDAIKDLVTLNNYVANEH